MSDNQYPDHEQQRRNLMPVDASEARPMGDIADDVYEPRRHESRDADSPDDRNNRDDRGDRDDDQITLDELP